MLFFPLAIVVGVLAARRTRLIWAMLAGAALFGIAVLVAWQAQGFPPSVRDLVWLGAVLVATWASSRYKRPATSVSQGTRDSAGSRE